MGVMRTWAIAKQSRFTVKEISRLLLLLLFVCCLVLVLVRPGTARAEAKTLKVGYDVSGVLLYKDNEGTPRGYDAEFLYEIAKYTGWQYEFVPYQSWARALQAVAAGEIDILPTVLKTPERTKTMLFANHWMGMIHVALVVPKNDRKHYYGDLDSMQGLKIGVRYNTKDADDVRNWAKEVGLRYQLTVYNDNQDLLQALDAGAIDAAGLSYVGRARQYRAIVEFAPQEMFFAVAPGRADVKVRMDMAMVRIAALNPEFFSNIVTKLAGRESNLLPVFSLKEEAFLKEAQPVRVTFIRQAAPFSYLDEQGQYCGLLPELLEKISQLSGLKFTYVPVDSGEEALQAIKEGRAQVLGRMVNDSFFAAKHRLRSTSPYVYLPLVRINSRDVTEFYRIGVQDVSQVEMALVINQDAEDKVYQAYDQVEKSFDDLNEHRIDALYCDSVTAGYFMENHRFSDYQFSVLQPYSYDLTFGVCQTADPRLAVILDKCIRCFSTKEVEEMFMQNRMQQAPSLRSLLDRIPVRYLIVIMGAMLVGILLFAYVSLNLWRKRNVEQRMQVVKERNQQMEADLKTAKRVEAAKAEFFTSISQQMSHPVMEIVESLQQAFKGKPEEQKQVVALVQKALASGIRLQDGLDDMQLFTALEYGKPLLKLERVDSREFLEQILAPYREKARQKGLEFSLDDGGLLGQAVMLDRRLVQAVFAKVLSNALNFTPAGGSLQVTLESLVSAKGRYGLWATVKDTGIGISKDFLPDIYEPFTKEGRPESRDLGGNGLGLTIARLVLNLLGGEIEVKSQYQKGTEVKLELYFDLADERC